MPQHRAHTPGAGTFPHERHEPLRDTAAPTMRRRNPHALRVYQPHQYPHAHNRAALLDHEHLGLRGIQQRPHALGFRAGQARPLLGRQHPRRQGTNSTTARRLNCIVVAPTLAYAVVTVIAVPASARTSALPVPYDVVVLPVIAVPACVSATVSVHPVVTVRLLELVAARVMRATHDTRYSPEVGTVSTVVALPAP